MSNLRDWLAKNVTYIGVLQSELFDGDEMMTIGEEGQTQIICDEAHAIRRTELKVQKAENKKLRAEVAEQTKHIVKLEELLSTSIIQTRELCELCKDRCARCPLHLGNDECQLVAMQNDARELGIEVGE